MAFEGFQFDYIRQGLVRSQVGIAYNETGFVGLYLLYHGHLIFDGLRAENKRNSTFLRQCDSHLVVGNCLHYSGDQWNVHSDCGFFTLSEFCDWSFEGYLLYPAVLVGISRYEKVFVKCS